MGRLGLIALGLMVTTDANAHCYSVWHYNFPQRCGGVYARANRNTNVVSMPVPSPRPSVVDDSDDVDIPIPDLAAFWVQDDTSEAMQRLKALRQLEGNGE